MKKLITSVIIGAAVLTACGGGSSQSTNPAEDASVKATNVLINELSAQEKADGWVLLFDGKTSNGWRGAHKDAFPEHGWKIENGELIVLASDGSESTNGGDIVSDGKYSAFELSVDFKITKGANSGIKYFVTEGEKQKDSAYGLEFQILDDESASGCKIVYYIPG